MAHFNGKAILAGTVAGALVLIGIYFGSGQLRHFDRALVWYAGGSMLAAFATGYRFQIWSGRPPTRMYFIRGLQLLFKSRTRGKKPFALTQKRSFQELLRGFFSRFIGQTQIRQRSRYRWWMHLLLSGGCTLAFAITFPLVFGWVHFETRGASAQAYEVMALGQKVDQFPIESFKGWLFFNLLNLSALMVLVGVVMATWRRLTHAGERAVQTFSEDFLPLLLIFAVTATGLLMTVSYKWMDGRGHGLYAGLHVVAVVGLLLFIPFGKLFHILQRTAHLMVGIYKRAGESGLRAFCRRCGSDYASLQHVADLKIVLDQLGFDYRYPEVAGESLHYQEICPACRRRLLALNQGRSLDR